jgi:E3 ubiquitin-protein ligase CHFR
MQKQGTEELDGDDKKTNSGTPWGKLTSINHLKMDNAALTEDSYTIGRNTSCKICIPDKRLSGQHCMVTKKPDDTVVIEDCSTNGTWLNEDKIGKGVSKELKNGDTIYLLHSSKVKQEEILGYLFSFANMNNNSNKRKADEEAVAKAKEEAAKEIEKKQKMDEELGEEMQCSICIDYIYQCITLIPCLHNFCASCYSDWMQKSKDCPSCRDPVTEARKNANVNNIIGKFLDSHPDKKRSKEEYDAMEKRNKFTSDKIAIAAATTNGKPKEETKAAPPPQPTVTRAAAARKRSPTPSDDSGDDDQCPECINARRGDNYKCKKGAGHLHCSQCAKPFPDRIATHPQQCVICKRNYCNLYFTCTAKTLNRLQLLKNHNPPALISDQVFKGNKYEAQLLRDYLFKKKLTGRDVFNNVLKDSVKNPFRYKASRAMLTNPPPVAIDIAMNQDTAVCTKCFDEQLWWQVCFKYFIDIKNDLPRDAQNRGSCWYGINCKTMVHSDDHAKKLNHVCEQIKF